MPERGSARGMRRMERHKCGASGIGNTCLPRVEAWEQRSRAQSRNYAVPSFQCQSAVGRPPFCEITWLSDLPQLPLAPASFVPLGADPGCAHPPPSPAPSTPLARAWEVRQCFSSVYLCRGLSACFSCLHAPSSRNYVGNLSVSLALANDESTTCGMMITLLVPLIRSCL